MTAEFLSRTEKLLGTQALEKLAASRVALFGLGGVGGYVLEALVRGGIGALDLIDKDEISVSNLNRQILATADTVGMKKVDAAKTRALSINPDCAIRTYDTFYLPDTADLFDFTQYDYIIDAIDTVTGKLTIIERANAAGVPVISCMGTGNKLDPCAFAVADLFQTTGDALAKVMRKECRKRGIDALKVVWSKEAPFAAEEGSVSEPAVGEIAVPEELPAGRRSLPGTVSFVPAAAGLILAGEVIKDLIRK